MFPYIMSVRAPPFSLSESPWERTTPREGFFPRFGLHFGRPGGPKVAPRGPKGAQGTTKAELFPEKTNQKKDKKTDVGGTSPQRQRRDPLIVPYRALSSGF